jgi:hypothetical protein
MREDQVLIVDYQKSLNFAQQLLAFIRKFGQNAYNYFSLPDS